MPLCPRPRQAYKLGPHIITPSYRFAPQWGTHSYVASLKVFFSLMYIGVDLQSSFKASVLWTSTTHARMMCSMLMFETLKLGIIDLQREPGFAINAEKK